VTTWLVLFSGLIAVVTIPLLAPGSRESKGRLMSMLMGVYMMLIGLVGTGATIYRAFFRGVVGISRNAQSATFAFESEPVAAFLTIGVQLLCALGFAAFGWHIFKGARDGKLGP
jgi:hypothetical protein